MRVVRESSVLREHVRCQLCARYTNAAALTLMPVCVLLQAGHAQRRDQLCARHAELEAEAVASLT